MSTPHHGRHRTHETHRALLVMLVVLVAGGLTVASILTRSTASPAPAFAGVSQVAPNGAESSSFVCGGFTEGAGSTVPGSVLITNATSEIRHASIEVVDDKGSQIVVKKTIDPRVTTAVPISGLLSGGLWVSATATFDGGGVAVVEQTTRVGEGSVTPCASVASPSWYFAGGSTVSGQDLVYSLVNPTATAAVVNVSFIGGGGLVQPQGSQGLVVPPSGLVTFSAVAVAPHIPLIGAIVQATQGSVVAFATQQSPFPHGVVLTLGESTLERRWQMARAVSTKGAVNSLVIANPTSQAQVVTVRARIPSGPLSPWSEVVAPYSLWQLVTAPASRVPVTDIYSAVVTTSGPGVSVSEVTQVVGAASAGWGSTPLAAPVVVDAGRWILPGSVQGTPIGMTFTNSGSSPVRVHASILTPAGEISLDLVDGTTIAAGESISLSSTIRKGIGTHPILISASGPLVVGEDLPFVTAPGVASIVALAILP